MSIHKVRRGVVLGTIVVGAMAAAGVSAVGPFGPSKFKIEQSDDRFSSDGLITVTGRNNRLTNRSISGGVYIDGKGLYLDPIVIKSRADGTIQQVGFTIYNDTEQGSRIGSLNLFEGLKKISFLIDGGKLITAEIADSALHTTGGTTTNPYLAGTYTSVRETGTITLSLADLAALTTTHTLAVQVEGGERRQTVEAAQVSKQFQPNLAAFYQQQITLQNR